MIVPQSKTRAAFAVVLKFLALCALVVFCFLVYSRVTPWYSSHPVISKWREDMTIKLDSVPIATKIVIEDGVEVVEEIGNDSPLVSGSTLLPIVMTWAPTLGIALCGAGLLILAQAERKSTKNLGSGFLSIATRQNFALTAKRVGILARYIANYQLPPGRFWAWWSGGMSVMDALLVCAWVGLAVNYLYHYLSSSYARTAARLTPPPAAFAPPPLPLKDSQIQEILTNAFLARRLESAASLFGATLRILMLVMYYPVSRSNVLAWVTGTDHSTLIRYHRWMGYGTVFIAFVHGLLYAIFWGAEGTLDYYLTSWTEHSLPNVPGLISLVAGLLMCMFSVTWMRRNFYWLFYYVHIVGFFVWTVFAVLHYRNLANWIVPGLILYCLDRAFRMWQTACNHVRLTAADIVVNDAVISLKLRWPKGAIVAAGQTLYLRCRSVSYLQAHPFSIASVAAGPKGEVEAIVHIKVLGQWTKGLRALAQKAQGLCLQVEGPYESTLIHAPKTPVVVMIAGGIGVTPLKGILESYEQAMRCSTSAREMQPYRGAAPPQSPSNSSGTSEEPKRNITQTLSEGEGLSVPQVYLLWSSRKICELQLLGGELLKAAMRGADHRKLPGATNHSSYEGWLQATLHYTGFELDEVTSKRGPLISSISGHHRLTQIPLKAIPSFDTNAVLDCQPGTELLSDSPSITPGYVVPAIVLSSFGAFAGLVLAWYHQAYQSRTTEDGANYSGVGAVQFMAIATGAVVLPLLYFTIYALCKQLHAKRQQPGDTTLKGKGAEDMHCGDADKTSAGSLWPCTAGIVALPGYQLGLAMGKEADFEGDAGLGSLQLQRGRADMRGLLNDVYKDHADELEIEVLVGGPESMYMDVLAMCQALSSQSWWGLRGPLLHCRPVAHQH